jgi:hypothetical protein
MVAVRAASRYQGCRSTEALVVPPLLAIWPLTVFRFSFFADHLTTVGLPKVTPLGQRNEEMPLSLLRV